MRKKSKQISAMIVAVALAMSSMSGTVSAKTVQTTNKVQGVAPKPEYRKGEAVVMYYGTTAKKSIASTDNRFGGNVKVEETYDFTMPNSKYKAQDNSNQKRLLVSKVSSKSYSTEELVSKLKEQSNVEYAEPNYIYKASGLSKDATPVHNTAKYAPYQWALKNVGQNNGMEGADIGIESAWGKKTGTKKVIAVVDTGVDYTDPELADNMWENPYQDKLAGEHGYDFMDHDDDPMDEDGHGSHCAGIIAGAGKGVSGVNQTAQLMALRWMDTFGGADADVIAAYDYINRALDLGVDVVAINNSWGGMGQSKILQQVIDTVGKKGAITVAAAGNEAMDLDRPENAEHCWNFKSDYKIEVAAINESGDLAGFSNYSTNYVDIAAPGCDILSTVKDDTYNPSIHLGDKTYSEMVDTFENEDDIKQYKILQKPDEPQMQMSVEEGNGFGKSGGSALTLTSSGTPEKEDHYVVYRPITLPKSSSDYNVGAMVSNYSGDSTKYQVRMGVNKISDLESWNDGAMADWTLAGANVNAYGNFWSQLSADTCKIEFPEEEQYALWFDIQVDGRDGFDLKIDDVGFSKKDMDQEEFGKYAFYNGTSMAAPYVTGAVALVSEIKGKMDPALLRETVLDCVCPEYSAGGYVRTGGTLDLSRLDEQHPMIKKVRTNNDTITISGNLFGSNPGTVLIDGKQEVVKSWSQGQIVVEEKDHTSREVELKITTSEGVSTEKKVYLGYNDTKISSLGKVKEFSTGVTATDGNSFYTLDKEGRFNAFASNNHEWTKLETLSPTVLATHNDIPGMAELEYDSQLVYANKALYVVASYDLGYSKEKALVCYDLKSGKWTKKAELPSGLNKVDASTLASYGDKLYLVGGYDTKNELALDTVYSLEYKKADAAFVKENATIPARFGAVAQVVAGKLVLTLGGDGTVDENTEDESYVPVPNNIVYDGQNWTEIKNSAVVPLNAEYYRYDEEEMTGVPCYKAQTGVYHGGLIYTNLQTKDFGDVFTYDLENNKYSVLPCSLQSYTEEGEKLYGTTVADQFMFYAGTQNDYDLYSFEVNTGFFKVSSNAGNVDGLGYYYPGSDAQVTPHVEEGQTMISFQVDGHEVNGDSYTITNIEKDHDVKVIMECKTTGLTLDTNQVQLERNQTYQLKAQVQPAAAADNKLSWKSNRTSIVSVSDNGELTAHKPGKAVITVSTTDGTKLMAKCEVEVRPEQVSGLNAVSTSNSIQLSWNKVEGASGYVVYRYDTKAKKDVPILTVLSSNKVSVNIKRVNGLTGSKLTPATEYTYKVAAFGMDGLKQIYGDKAKITTTTQPEEK